MTWLARLIEQATTPAPMPESPPEIKEDCDPFKNTWEIALPDGTVFWIVKGKESIPFIPPDTPFFEETEIELLHRAGRESAKAALEIKRQFGHGAKVVSVTEVKGDGR